MTGLPKIYVVFRSEDGNSLSDVVEVDVPTLPNGETGSRLGNQLPMHQDVTVRCAAPEGFATGDYSWTTDRRLAEMWAGAGA